MGREINESLDTQLRIVFRHRFSVQAVPAVTFALVEVLLLTLLYPDALAGLDERFPDLFMRPSALVLSGAAVIFLGAAANVVIAWEAAKKAQLAYLSECTRIIETAREAKREEEYTSARPAIVIFKELKGGPWRARLRDPRTPSADKSYALSFDPATSAEEVFIKTKRDNPGHEVSVTACVLCGALAHRPGGALGGRPVTGRYEFKKNRLELPHAHGNFFCLACSPPKFSRLCVVGANHQKLADELDGHLSKAIEGRTAGDRASGRNGVLHFLDVLREAGARDAQGAQRRTADEIARHVLEHLPAAVQVALAEGDDEATTITSWEALTRAFASEISGGEERVRIEDGKHVIVWNERETAAAG